MKRKAQLLVKYLLGDGEFDLDSLTDVEIAGASLALIAHRRVIRTKAFNDFLSHLKKRPFPEDEDSVWLAYQDFDKALEKEEFNFRGVEVELEIDEDFKEDLKKRTFRLRITQSVVQKYIDRFTNKAYEAISSTCPGLAIDKEDIRSELLFHLVSQAEQKFDPLRAAYPTFAFSVLDKKTKSIIKKYRADYSHIPTSIEKGNSDESWQLDPGVEENFCEQLIARHDLDRIFKMSTPLALLHLYYVGYHKASPPVESSEVEKIIKIA